VPVDTGNSRVGPPGPTPLIDRIKGRQESKTTEPKNQVKHFHSGCLQT